MTELGDRYIVQARLLGMDKAVKRRWKREQEFAIDVTLSDESNYTIFRRVKEITAFHAKLVSQFPVEAGYFSKSDMVIPDCPLKQTIFGPSRVISNDRVFEKLLNSYFKEIPGLPTSIIKCNLISNFFALRGSDMSEPGKPPQQMSLKPRKKQERVVCSKDSSISGPIRLRSYYAVAEYKDTKTKFLIPEGTVVQVVQKDASGWWRVDLNGKMGWAPASFLVPVDDDDLEEEAKENKAILSSMRAGARYISTSAYQASRDDEVSFVRGAVVKLIKKYADGWWLVRYNGGEGYVPGSMFRKFDRRQATAYVKKIQRQFKNRKSTKIIPTIKTKWMENHSTGLILYQCTAKYRPSDTSELSMNKDDILKVLDKKDHGWWYVEDKHGRSGWAPATFLQPVVDGKKEKSDRFENGIVGSTYEVKQSYSAKVEDEVSAGKGDKVLVLSAPDNGWWFVKKVETNEQGLIPSLCFNEGTSGSTPLGPETETIKSASDIPDPLQSINEEEEEEDERKEKGKEVEEADLIEEDEEEEQEVKENGKEEEEEEAEEDEDEEGCGYYSDGDDLVLENCYTAIEDYTKQAQDELSVYQGQMVYAVDDSDEDMFYVVVDGKEGWIPAGVLTALSEEELEGCSSTLCSPRSQSRSCSPIPVPSQRTGSPFRQSSRSPSPSPRQHRHRIVSPFRNHSPLHGCWSASPQLQRGLPPSPQQAHSPCRSQSPCLRYTHTLSRSPSPISHLDEEDVSKRESLKHPHIQTHRAPREDLLSSTDHEVARINKLQMSTSSSIEIRVEEHASVEQIEKAAAEAERFAQEAQRKAVELREMVLKVKRTSSEPLTHTN